MSSPSAISSEANPWRRLERQAAVLTDPSPTNSQAERSPDLAVVEATTGGCREHKIVRTFVPARHPSGTKESHHRRREHDLSPASFRLETSVLSVARQLTMYPQDVSLEVHVGPSQAESLTDPQSCGTSPSLPQTRRLVFLHSSGIGGRV
jgi:hypothetical protein